LRIPLSWLSEYVDLALPPPELARRLTIAGVEVAGIESPAGEWDGIVVAEVLRVDPHPDADRLCLVTANTGAGQQTVVCGAPNVAAGQKVAFAPVGTRLIDGHTGKPTLLKPARIRGVQSAGMVLSEKELGLSEAHEGILVLPPDAVPGRPLADVLGQTAFQMDIRPNRPDLLSVLGVAREVAALTGRAIREPSTDYPAQGRPAKRRFSVEISDPDLCHRYVGGLIEELRVADSPPWLQERLTAAGMRPITNVVDITNYVMLELGQPLHAFDFERLRGGKIIVRRARAQEKLQMLDGSERELSPDMLVIADSERALAVAGVMGGSESEVSAGTRSILLESANFDAASIRRTSQALRLRTDASVRFEKGLSRGLPAVAARRATKLFVDICGGRVSQDIVDVFPGKEKDLRITLTQERLHRVLGAELTKAEVRRVLEGLGFGCRWLPPDHYVVRVPYWRSDIAIAEDVIEEVARIIGYDQLPTALLSGEVPEFTPDPRSELRETVRDALCSAGMQEVITYSLTTLEALQKVLAPEDLATYRPLRVANPMSREHEYLRTTLRASVLQTLSRNLHANPGLTALFETARVYIPNNSDLPQETDTVCAVISGRHADRWGRPTGSEAGFYDAKSYLERLLDLLHLPAAFQEKHDFAYLPGRTAAVLIGQREVGTVGELHPRVCASFDIDGPVAMFELDIDALRPHLQPAVHYQPVSPFPPVEQDLALILPAETEAARPLQIIADDSLVENVSVFDVYTGPPVPPGRKSIAFAISFRSPDHTLTDEEVARHRRKIIARLERDLDAEVRA